MARRTPAGAAADITLRFETPEPDLSRVVDIRKWMISQATAQDPPVAGLALTISASGQLDAAVRGIEPEHADLVIEQLDRLRASLQAWADAACAPQSSLCKVFRIDP